MDSHSTYSTRNSVGGIVLHFFFFAYWTTIPKYIPVCQKVCDWPCPKSTSVLQGDPLKEMHYRTECDVAYCELFISEFCTCRLVLWSQLQMDFLHWDQIQNFSCGGYLVYSHSGSPNAYVSCQRRAWSTCFGFWIGFLSFLSFILMWRSSVMRVV